MSKQCRVQLILPSADGGARVQFTCNEAKDHVDPQHVETGRVRDRGAVKEYTVVWRDLPNEVWRG